MDERCEKCGAPLTQDEIALHRKLVSRGAEKFWCKECLSAHFDIPVKRLDELVVYYREAGCTLFT
ncbi:MAG: hypothetical protein IJ493_02280 [Clostridia bacterium]|nr:hypothetical protein [Clostridia bacterium]